MAHWKEFSKRRGEKISYEITRTLLEGRTTYQEVGIYDTVSNGRALFLDGKIQSAETDEFIYHEALVQPALICHPNPRRVYIAGGGEGATLREILRHKSVESAVMVDLDGEVCAAARQHLGIWHAGAYDDPRTTLLHQDARAWLVDSTEPFDSVIVDVTDPLAGGPSYMLFTKEFYQIVYDHLAPGGTIAVQAESTDVTVLEGHLALVRTLAEVFPVVHGYHAHVPSFAEAWGFVIGCKPNLDGSVVDPATLTAAEVDATLAARGLADGLRFYDGITHERLFRAPKYERVAAAKAGPIITDDSPLVID
jgi:spermidine synthase